MLVQTIDWPLCCHYNPLVLAECEYLEGDFTLYLLHQHRWSQVMSLISVNGNLSDLSGLCSAAHYTAWNNMAALYGFRLFVVQDLASIVSLFFFWCRRNLHCQRISLLGSPCWATPNSKLFGKKHLQILKRYLVTHQKYYYVALRDCETP